MHKNDFVLYFSSLSPLMSCMTAGFCVCLLSCWTDAIRIVFSVVSVLPQKKIAYKIPVCLSSVLCNEPTAALELFSKDAIKFVSPLIKIILLNSSSGGWRTLPTPCVFLCTTSHIILSFFNSLWSDSDVTVTEAPSEEVNLRAGVSEFNSLTS